MEFNEYSDLLGKDYDIKASLNEELMANSYYENPYAQILCDEIGILEDINDKQLMEIYGITVSEYLNPTKETILKVRASLESKKNGHCR